MLRQDITQGVKEAPRRGLAKVVMISAASRYWFVHRRTVEMAIDRGRLSAAVINGFWYVSVNDLNSMWGKHEPGIKELLYIDVASLTSHANHRGIK